MISMLNLVARLIKSAFQVSQDKHIQRFKDHESEVAAIAAISDGALLNRLRNLEYPINRVVDQAILNEEMQRQSHYTDMMNWLSSTPFKLHHERISEHRLPYSGEWLLNHPQYIEWKASSASSIFLLVGSAGSGKSSLASVVVDSFNNEAAFQASPAPIAYFYCGKSAPEPGRSDPNEILRSILRQLSTDPKRKTLHRAVAIEYDRRSADAKADGFDVQRLASQDCTKLILDITSLNPVTVIIDAVDEIPKTRRAKLTQAFKAICNQSSNVIKVFMTSRDNEQIKALLPNASTFHVDAGSNSMDMNRFVQDRVLKAVTDCSLLDGKVGNDLRQDLEQALLNSASGR